MCFFWTFSNRLIVFFFSISLRLVDLMQQSNVYAMQSRSNSLFGNIFTATATAVLLMNCSKSKVREKTTSSWSGRRGAWFSDFHLPMTLKWFENTDWVVRLTWLLNNKTQLKIISRKQALSLLSVLFWWQDFFLLFVTSLTWEIFIKPQWFRLNFNGLILMRLSNLQCCFSLFETAAPS